MRRQLERYRRLGRGGRLVEHSPRRLTIDLREGTDLDLVAETVAIERECCSFFSVSWDPAGLRLSFSVASAEHEPALDAILFALGLATPTAPVSDANVEIVRQAVAAINDRDVERYLALCAPDIELISPVAAIEGASAGAGGIREFFAGLDEAASEFHLRVESLDELGDGRVLASLHVSMESSGGVALTQPIFNVYALAGGKLSRVEVFRDRAEALGSLGREV